jgi:hypothetical protein
MLNFDEFEPLVEAAQTLKNQCSRDSDKSLHMMSDKAFCATFIAGRHSLLAARKIWEATMARAYADQLSVTPGMGRQAERERVRASTLEMQAEKHREASEKCQADGDQLAGECLGILKRRGGGQPAQQRPQTPAPPPPAPAPARTARFRPPQTGGDGDGGDGDGDGQ